MKRKTDKESKTLLIGVGIFCFVGIILYFLMRPHGESYNRAMELCQQQNMPTSCECFAKCVERIDRHIMTMDSAYTCGMNCFQLK